MLGLQRVSAIELDITHASLQLRQGMLSRTPSELAATLADVAAKRQCIAELMTAYEASLSTPEAHARFAGLSAKVGRFWQDGEANIALIQDGRQGEAFGNLVDKAIPARNEPLADLAQGVRSHRSALIGDIQEIKRQASTTMNWLIAMVVGVIGLLAGSCAYVAASVQRRVAVSQAAAERVRDGDFTPFTSQQQTVAPPQTYGIFIVCARCE